ncbi:glycosyltransferase [Prosthecochloris sp. CIB 2401]|uniref:glycosyltransferase n=1 Tax=Prosthecochloris sp. CIB 2401 TaxID=1868325 RepID=UPI00080AA1FA|nr:glycosyltransferase [Prosthecochloris sp. CIB 2401]ANT64166.1 protein glycosylation J [Prosthecochloris sp. CIB 2401]
MNIMFLNSARRGWGGNEKWMRLAATELQKSHTVLLAYRDPEIGNRIPTDGIRLPFRHEADLETIMKLAALVRQHNIDVLIPTKRKDYVLAGIVARLTGCCNILRLGIVRDMRNSVINNLVYNILADGIIVNARHIKTTLLNSSTIPEEKIRVIYNGVDRQNILELAKETTINPPFAFTITGMGELSPRKGFKPLICGFAQFLQQTKAKDASLVIIGQGTEKDELAALATQLGIDKQVRFTGFLDNPYPWLKTSSVFAMISENEGISNAVLEAAVLQNAIITTASGGGITEVFSHNRNALLLPDSSPERIAKALNALYSNPAQCRSLAEQASKTVEETFNLDKMTREITTFCQQTIERKKS